MKSRLESLRLEGAVSRLEIIVEQLCAEQSHQLELLDAQHRNNGALRAAITQLQAKYGSSVIKKPLCSKIPTKLPEKLFSLVDFA